MIVSSSQDVGAAIRLARKAKGVGQVELAARIGKHQSLVSRVERGGEAEFPTILDIFRELGLVIHVAGVPGHPLGSDDVLDGAEAFEAEGPALAAPAPPG